MMKILCHPYAQLSVSGRRKCLQGDLLSKKGIDNVFLMRINEHSASTNPLLQGHTWNTWMLFPLVYNEVHYLYAPVSHALVTLQ